MLHIFILDDNVTDSGTLLLAFKRTPYDTSVYAVSDSRLLPAYLDIKSPVETMRNRGHPHVLVVSMALAFYTGLETLAWIRARPRFDDMFVVMMSSTDDPVGREKAEAAGADAFHVRAAGNKNLNQLAEQILLEYTQRQPKPDLTQPAIGAELAGVTQG